MIIVFDLDGTLLDVRRRHRAVYAAVVAELGGRPLALEDYWEAKRHVVPNVELLERSGLDATHAEVFLERFVARIEAPGELRADELQPCALATLDALRPRHRLVLATLRRAPAALDAQLGWTGLRDRLDDVLVGSPEVGKAALMQQLAEAPAVVVGDTEADIRAARAVGAVAVAVTTGIRSATRLRAEAPDHLCHDLNDVREVLERHG